MHLTGARRFHMLVMIQHLIILIPEIILVVDIFSDPNGHHVRIHDLDSSAREDTSDSCLLVPS